MAFLTLLAKLDVDTNRLVVSDLARTALLAALLKTISIAYKQLKTQLQRQRKLIGKELGWVKEAGRK